jgi:hypothetical protein
MVVKGSRPRPMISSFVVQAGSFPSLSVRSEVSLFVYTHVPKTVGKLLIDVDRFIQRLVSSAPDTELRLVR